MLPAGLAGRGQLIPFQTSLRGIQSVTAGRNLCPFPLCSLWAPQLPSAAAAWAVFSSRSTVMPLHHLRVVSYAANAVALLV